MAINDQYVEITGLHDAKMLVSDGHLDTILDDKKKIQIQINALHRN